MITVFITDDHPLVSKGIRDMLSPYPSIQIIGTFLSGAALLAGIKVQQPDVLLLDIQLPDMRGEEITLMLRKNFPDVKVLALTNFNNTLYASNMLKSGAFGYLLKNTDEETLVDAIETVYRGETYLSPDMKIRVEDFRKKIQRKTSSKASLTIREIEILTLLTKGFSNQQIADELFLSKRTVENYRLNLTLKLEVKNTAGLVKYAVELGLDK
ncbi:response regulator [Taibaiella helva]|uniref:response regulator n=1 Tax=Taibaiella helva TaxID=2301235 RepID=UPI000E576C58|nr:response regulator transcription factor [Taibaiella helva]